MASIEIKASRMGKSVVFSLPCRERELKENLTDLYGTPPSHAVIEVAEVTFPKELEALTGQMLDLDALNYLARRMDGFDQGEANAFFEGMKAEGMTDLKDLINLTCNLNRYSLITNVGSFAEIGRAHTLNTTGAIPTRENETPEQTAEYERIGRDLIASGTGRFTEHGLLFVDREMEFVSEYDGTAFPPYYDCPESKMTAMLSFNGKEELLFLPEEESAINKAVRRLGAGELSDCDITLEQGSAGLIGQLYESINRSEGLLAMNEVIKRLDGMDYEDTDFLLLLARHTGASTAENISILADHIDDLYLIPAQTYRDVSNYVLEAGDEYHADMELWGFLDMDAFGKYYAEQKGGIFIESGLLCSSTGQDVKTVLDQLDPEPGLHLQQ